jgi:hypothetical protein
MNVFTALRVQPRIAEVQRTIQATYDALGVGDAEQIRRAFVAVHEAEGKLPAAIARIPKLGEASAAVIRARDAGYTPQARTALEHADSLVGSVNRDAHASAMAGIAASSLLIGGAGFGAFALATNLSHTNGSH